MKYDKRPFLSTKIQRLGNLLKATVHLLFRPLLLGPLLLGTFLLSACSTSGTTNQTIPIVHNAVITVAVPALPTNFNPNVPAGNNFLTQQIMDCLWPQIFSYGGDYQTSLDTAVISQAELISIDPEKIQYTIAPNAVWSDGTPITLSDFVFNWKAHIGIGFDLNSKPFQTIQQPGYSDIASIEPSQNNQSFTVTFIKPFADWESLFSNLVPAHIASKVGWNSGFTTVSPTVEVSAGPYLIGGYVPNQSLTLIENKKYNGAKPHISKIIFKVFSTSQAMLQAVQTNQAQLTIGQFNPITVANLNKSNTLNAETHKTFSAVMMTFNPSVAVFASSQLRQAISSLIDYNQLTSDTEGLYNSGAYPLTNMIFVQNQSGYSNDAAGILQPNTAAFSQLLASVGLSYNPQGILIFNNQPVSFTLGYDSNDLLQSMAAANLQAQFRDAGIVVNLQSYPTSISEQSALQSGNFQMTIEKVTQNPSLSYTTASLTQDQFYDQQNGTWPMGTGVNPATVLKSTPQIASLIDQADSSLDTLKSQDLYQQADVLLWQSFLTVPLFEEPMTIVTSTLLQNVKFNPSIFGPFSSVTDWAVINQSALTTSS